MIISKEDFLAKVVSEYIELNIQSGRYRKEDVSYMAPEQLDIPSNQVKALANVFYEELKKLESLIND